MHSAIVSHPRHTRHGSRVILLLLAVKPHPCSQCLVGNDQSLMGGDLCSYRCILWHKGRLIPFPNRDFSTSFSRRLFTDDRYKQLSELDAGPTIGAT